MARAMAAIAEQPIFAIDQSKLDGSNDQGGLLAMGRFEKLPWIVTDASLPMELRGGMEELGRFISTR